MTAPHHSSDNLALEGGGVVSAVAVDSKSLGEFNSLSITEILDQDSRPTFVIDLDPDEDAPVGAAGISPVFCNSALRLHERLLDVVVGKGAETNDPTTSEPPSYDDFRSWATGVTKFDDSKDVFPLSYLFSDMLWTGSTVRKRWRLISGNLFNPGIPARDLSPLSTSVRESRVEPASEKSSLRPSVAPTRNSTTNTGPTTIGLSSTQKRSLPRQPGTSSDSTANSSQSKRLALAAPDKVVADWTVPNPKGILSPHVAFARTVHWEATPLGPMDKWSPEFRQTVNLVMSNPHPASLFWGSDLTMLYNEAYAAEVAGHKHPNLMGTGFSGPFSELWDSVSEVFAECARTGVSIRKEDDYLPIERHGFLEETFYSWSWTPLYGGTNRILGFYNAPFETTQSVLSHRRMHTINKVGANLSHAKSVKQFWKFLLEGLEDNHFDVPFALLYSVGDSEDIDEDSISSGSTMCLKSCYFEGAIAVPDGHAAAPQQVDLKRSLEGFVPAFREAMRTREPTLLHTRDGTLPEELMDGINWRGFGDPCNQAIIFPVRPTNGEQVLAFLLLGVNPRRPYDDGYRAFTSMLNRQLATSLASFMLFEEEVRRNRDAAEAAALESEHLSQQLALQTSRLRRMTELSPLGMFLVSPEGVLREANDRYYEMTGHPRDGAYEMSWMEQIMESSKPKMAAGWNQLTVDHLPWTGELQLERLLVKPVDLDGEEIEYWVMVSSQPEFAADGSLRSIMGSITDISHLKWAQGLQNRRLQEAEETRRQQNEFIDITSHEMRNPLSAILQCADDILTTLDDHRQVENPPTMEAVESCLEAAHTISLCVQHQKSIVDDILTVSKLDSNLLVITPVPAQPIEVVKRAVKMFDPELQAKDIQMVCEAHPSFKFFNVDWVTFDPSRVLQILINLM
jgi:PAS domain S-box-containing protein